MIDESDFLELASVFGLTQGPVFIAGTLGAGNVLTASMRSGYSATGFQWTRNGSDISGQTANTYTQLTSDRGAVIGCRAIGLSYAGSGGTVPVVAPGAPTGVSASAGNASVTGTFTAPADNGGSAITAYQMAVYRASDNAYLGSANGGASPLTLNGLTNGVAVYVTVAAVNAIGVGTPSATHRGVSDRKPKCPEPCTSDRGSERQRDHGGAATRSVWPGRRRPAVHCEQNARESSVAEVQSRRRNI
ncbi:fibronectin type III domain-containing protein [Herbaspirillum huttiense]|uniref:fibronectin type III domain-containing protein n=1 Tax=Herbaspirillum huttiense TaxID=863372 RepID=UPI0012FEE3F0|nr:hypothetical protein [Herbaspirillum huttiense]